MAKEIWKDVVDYEGLYQVSNLGNFKSLPRNGTIKTQKILVGGIDNGRNIYKSDNSLKQNNHAKIRYHRPRWPRRRSKRLQQQSSY